MSVWLNRIGGTSLAVFTALSLLSMPSLAQQEQPQEWTGEIFEIVVTSPGVEVQETRLPMGRGSRVSMSYTVDFADLNLTTENGRGDLEERVREAANEMCLLLAERYAGSRTGAARCTRQAIDDAMPQVQAAVEAAGTR